MLNLQTQEKVMRDRLQYYHDVIKERPAEYGHFKRTISIPRTHQALRKISNGTYGDCEGKNCDERIPDERLEAIPAALLCIDCQRTFENNH
jgi:RNA polymerase-binding transcription factor DksA